MMRRLQAEESLLMYERLGAGTGAFTTASRKQVVKSWESSAEVRRRRHSPAPPTMLGSMGIRYQVVTRKKPRT